MRARSATPAVYHFPVPSEMPCPHYVETVELLRAAEQSAKEGELVAAVCWWHESLRPLALIADRARKTEAERLTRECLERLTEQDKARSAAAAGV